MSEASHIDDKSGDTGQAGFGGMPQSRPQESYQVLARKYRPQSFDDLIGQDAMVQTLRNAFDTGRIAHAFILTGVRGVGKTTTARILARALNYAEAQAGVDAPSLVLNKQGTHCAAIMEGAHVDVIEMDAASHTGIDNIREIIDSVRYPPTSARYKVYIIDEVHMLSRSAFNGLLKTLEEPPPYVKFIFATTEIRMVPVTVLSRCQRFDLRRLTLDEIHVLFKKVCANEGVELPDETLTLLARAADGSARDALSLLDRAFAHGGDDSAAIDGDAMRMILGMANRERLFDLFDLLFKGDLSAALGEFEAHYTMGTEPATILADLAELVYWLTRIKYIEAAADDVTFSEAMRQRGREAAAALPTRILTRAWQILLQGYQEVRLATNTRAAAEMVLIRLAHLADAPTPQELIQQFEKNSQNNMTAPAARSAPVSASTSSSTSSVLPTASARQQGAPALQSAPQISEPTIAAQDANRAPILKAVPQADNAPDKLREALIRTEPQVKAALAAFPDAKIRAVIDFTADIDTHHDDTEEDT